MPNHCILPLGLCSLTGRIFLFAVCAVILCLSMLGCRSIDTSPSLTQAQPESQQSAAVAADDGPMLPTLKLDDEMFKWTRPSNERNWTPGMERLAKADFNGDRVTIRNIRSCSYRTYDDFDTFYYDKTFDLNKLTAVDMIVVPFNEIPAIAHTMLTFSFEDKDFVSVSVEIRREKGEKYSPVKGFFRQYELMYVVADERDVIPKNANQYPSEVYLYRSTATPEQARELFADVMKRVDKLDNEPEFYNTLTNNCTTNIRNHINNLKKDRVPYDYRVLLPGYSDSLAYDLGLIESHGTFAQTKERAKINYQAYLYRNDPDFSQKIRR